MANDGYDRDDMELRGLIFEAAKLTSMATAIHVEIEWNKLEKENPSFSNDYPAITSLIRGNLQLLDKNSFNNKLLFENPLLKLAMISQAPPTADNNEKENGDEILENPPG